MLTDAQAWTIGELFNLRIKPGDSFFAYTAFPHRDNQDNGHRRVLKALWRKGLLNKPSSPKDGDYTMTQAAMKAHFEWFDAKGKEAPNQFLTN